jgi:hypothetical protein
MDKVPSVNGQESCLDRSCSNRGKRKQLYENDLYSGLHCVNGFIRRKAIQISFYDKYVKHVFVFFFATQGGDVTCLSLRIKHREPLFLAQG